MFANIFLLDKLGSFTAMVPVNKLLGDDVHTSGNPRRPSKNFPAEL